MLYRFEIFLSQIIIIIVLPQKIALESRRPPPKATLDDLQEKFLENWSSNSSSNSFIDNSVDIGEIFQHFDPKSRGDIDFRHNETLAAKFLELYAIEAGKIFSASMFAAWNYFTNLTEQNRGKLVGNLSLNFLSTITLTNYYKLICFDLMFQMWIIYFPN